MAKILGVGIATLDIINEVDGDPPEDSEVRALAQHRRTGGNVANTLTVLSQLAHQGHFAGVLTQDSDGLLIQEKLQQQGIDLSHAVRIGYGHAPTSYITLNRVTGSRSIVHFRDLPEYDVSPFLKIDLNPFDWLHFEGRHCMDTAAMLAWTRKLHPEMPISLEVEKERPFLDQLFPFPDVVFFSRAFALGRGFAQPEAFLAEAATWAPQAVLILGWGAAGAYLRDPTQTGLNAHIPSTPVDSVVDTIGAGDTLIAGVIHGRLDRMTWPDALTFGVRLAEKKIAQSGFENLGSTEEQTEQPLCRLDDLGPADALGVRPIQGIPSIVVVREHNRIQAFANVCPHNGSPLARTARRGYLVEKPSGPVLRCDVHNAHFDPQSGYCTKGPCTGRHLQPVPLRIQQGRVYLDGEVIAPVIMGSEMPSS
ncbi:MAG: PfkB family carbohydrate kinase [Halothiobacillus sp.]|jgi:ketohexokinase|nr:PfkB family carbohydrate kinase [Halothiobacillus sp.]